MKYSVAMKDREGERHNLVIDAPTLNNALMQAHKKYRGGHAVAANPWSPPGQGRHNRNNQQAQNGGDGIYEVGSPEQPSHMEVMPPENMAAMSDRIVMSVPWNCDVFVRRRRDEEESRGY